MQSDLDDVTASYHRCRARQTFVDDFYKIFLAKSPEIAAKFRNTDMERQKLMLRQSLLLMLSSNIRPDETREELERLAERHSRHGVDIPPAMYDSWLDALCEAVQRNDPEYTPALRTIGAARCGRVSSCFNPGTNTFNA